MSADKSVQSRPRWRVAIVDDHERSRSALRAAIWAAGGEVVGESVRCADALAVVRRAAPDVAICAAGLPDGDGVQTAAQLTAGDCPVVLFTSHTDEALVERARAAGIMAYLLKPLRPAELAPALDLASRGFRRPARCASGSRGASSSSAPRARYAPLRAQRGGGVPADPSGGHGRPAAYRRDRPG